MMEKVKCTSVNSCVINAINARELVNPRNLYNYRYLPILCVRSVRSRPQTRRRGINASVNKRARVYRCTHTERGALKKRGDNRLCYARRIIEPNSRKPTSPWLCREKMTSWFSTSLAKLLRAKTRRQHHLFALTCDRGSAITGNNISNARMLYILTFRVAYRLLLQYKLKTNLLERQT